MHPTLHSSQLKYQFDSVFQNKYRNKKQTNKQANKTEELNRINVLSMEKIQTKNQFKQNKKLILKQKQAQKNKNKTQKN